MKKYKTTIGLEIHAELKTETKMFCGCKNNPDEKRPNFNICPICMAHPGTLPAINKQAVKNVLKVGLAVGGQLADWTEFDRKNYFYPDIPKGYQISQYKYPLVAGGELQGVKITRVHLEEDTARSAHNGEFSLLDFNRAGVPLMELVTEPVIDSARQAGDFAKELRLLLLYLNVSDANMEKGEMRVEANISVSCNCDELGTKVEIKNLNSFRVVEKAIEYEIQRQAEALEKGEKIIQETRGWNEAMQKTFSQRIKEGSKDYRYFPEPDLPKLQISAVAEFTEAELKKEIPELPQAKRERYATEFGIKGEDIESFILDSKLADFFEEVATNFVGDLDAIKLASNYVTSDLIGLLKLERGASRAKTGEASPRPSSPQVFSSVSASPVRVKKSKTSVISNGASVAKQSSLFRLCEKRPLGATKPHLRVVKQSSPRFLDRVVAPLRSAPREDDWLRQSSSQVEPSSPENCLGKITTKTFVELIKLTKDKKISSRGAKDILAIMFETGGTPEEIAKENNLFQKSDAGELQKIIDQTVAENPAVVAEYKNGKETALQFLVGQAMKISRGSANPEKLSELFKVLR